MTVKELIVQLVSLASVHGDDMEVLVAVPDKIARGDVGMKVGSVQMSPPKQVEHRMLLIASSVIDVDGHERSA